MQNFRQKRVVFLTADSPLLTLFARECETEVIPSISFLQSFTERWKPDLLLGGLSTVPQLKQIRQTVNLRKVPLLVVHDDFSEIDFPEEFYMEKNTAVVNECVAVEEKFIAHMLGSCTRKSSLKSGTLVKKAIIQMNRELSGKNVRQTVSEKIGISDDYLSKIFLRETGMKFWDYLMIIRLEEARKLTEATSLSFSDIALRCGFTDDSHLSNCFRKKFGYPPGHLRKV